MKKLLACHTRYISAHVCQFVSFQWFKLQKFLIIAVLACHLVEFTKESLNFEFLLVSVFLQIDSFTCGFGEFAN